MENQDVLDAGLHGSDSLSLTSAAKEFLLQTSKWTRFLSILGFIFSGFIIIIGLAFGSLIGQFSGLGALGSGISGFIGVFYAILGAILFYPALRLFQFSKQSRMAVDHEDSAALEEAMRRMRSFFRFYGIIMIIDLAFIAIGLLFSLIGLSRS